MGEKRKITGGGWEAHWEKNKRAATWDYLSQIIFDVMARAPVSGGRAKVLEAGSGSGRISHRLAQAGADAALLDISENALEISKGIFESAGTPGLFHHGSVFEMPFGDGGFDVVWNAGVLEHFEPPEQARLAEEMARVCRPGGLVVLFNPNVAAPLFRIGVLISNFAKTWPYGLEVPVRPVAELIAGLPLSVEREFRTGFFVMFVEGFRFVPGFAWVTRALRKIFIAIHISPAGPALEAADRLLSRLFGGYLVVSVLRKNGA